MKYSKKNNLICFSKKELQSLYEVTKKRELLGEMVEKKFSFNDLAADYSKMETLADVVSKRGAEDRDEHEIFAGLFVFLNFFESDSEVCFDIQNRFDPGKDKINTLEDLVNFREVNSDSDFGIMSKDGLRKFQLKRYRGDMSAEGILDFVKKKMEHYGNDLGDTNLLVQLQPPAYTASRIEFHELHEGIGKLGLKSQGQILVSYNQNNQEHVLIEVHPKLAKTKIPIHYFSKNGASK